MKSWRVDLTVDQHAGVQRIIGTVTPPPEAAPDALGAIQAWLANISPDELQRVSLEDMDPMDGNFAAAMLATLRKWAGGNP